MCVAKCCSHLQFIIDSFIEVYVLDDYFCGAETTILMRSLFFCLCHELNSRFYARAVFLFFFFCVDGSVLINFKYKTFNII